MGLWLPGQAPEQTSPFAQRPVTTRQRWPYLRGQNPQLVISIKALHLQEHEVKHVNTGAQIQADWDLTKPGADLGEIRLAKEPDGVPCTLWWAIESDTSCPAVPPYIDVQTVQPKTLVDQLQSIGSRLHTEPTS